jgi:hypothetical protein
MTKMENMIEIKSLVKRFDDFMKVDKQVRLVE